MRLNLWGVFECSRNATDLHSNSFFFCFFLEHVFIDDGPGSFFESPNQPYLSIEENQQHSTVCLRSIVAFKNMETEKNKSKEIFFLKDRPTNPTLHFK